MARANWWTAPLVTSYSTSAGVAATAEIDDVHTIDPPPASSMPGSTAWVMTNMERTLTSMRKSYSSWVVSRNGFTTSVPAWLNSSVGTPSASVPCATAARTWSGWETSARARYADPPAASTSATSARPRSS